jgi:hypothetical protein
VVKLEGPEGHNIYKPQAGRIGDEIRRFLESQARDPR